MANSSRQIHQLNALRVSREVEPAYHADGGGLYLQISPSGSRSWIFRYSLFKRSREMGLGPLSVVSLSEARAEAARCRKLLAEGIDPIEARKARALALAPDGLTFRQAAQDYIDAHRPSLLPLLAGWTGVPWMPQSGDAGANGARVDYYELDRSSRPAVLSCPQDADIRHSPRRKTRGHPRKRVWIR